MGVLGILNILHDTALLEA